MAVLVLFLGGIGGAFSRLLIDKRLQAGRGTPTPWSGLAVNATGCFVLGALAGLAHTRSMPTLSALLAAAIMTFSIFGYATSRLVEDHHFGRAGLTALVGWLIGTATASVGLLLTLN
ncbi:CrcB family protein [Streptomyces sp. TS71-3]|uniref:fluoride efflux transporter FluC n=1 Tax=Streptomyces sp. TS71-3 TaxID=2733862 RepID=UPI001B06EFBB|nr:CrcB family protein [Streptomyces sp. TS71-3]GHJ41186.1 hypothetical protein Sm713_67950 [Streptomyces sp. TS71-3]